jgi:RHS repeat-associated protein
MGCRNLDISDCFIFSTEKDHFAAHFEYSPFGKIISENGSMPEKFAFRFSSEYNDSETGLVYYNYRYYSPELGRWLNRDPIEERGGPNLYGFVGNDGVNGWDYLGMEWTVTREGKARAKACRDSTKGKWTDLAKKVGLGSSYSEILKWLKLPNGSNITPGDVGDKFNFSVPNTVYITYGDLTAIPGGFSPRVASIDAMNARKAIYEENGYLVKPAVEPTSLAVINSVLQDKNIAKWAHAGHGYVTIYRPTGGKPIFWYTGKIILSDENFHGAKEFKPHHKLSELYLFSCYGGQDKAGWQKLVSKNGKLFTWYYKAYP